MYTCIFVILLLPSCQRFMNACKITVKENCFFEYFHLTFLKWFINKDNFFVAVNAKPVSCQLHGPFTFTYSRGHGECNYPVSHVDTCTDDSRLLFRFQACADVLGTESSGNTLCNYV